MKTVEGVSDSYRENESAVCQPTTNQADKETDTDAEWKTPEGDNQLSVCLKGGRGRVMRRENFWVCCVGAVETARKSNHISTYSTT